MSRINPHDDEALAAEAREERRRLAEAVNSKIKRHGKEIILPAEDKPMSAEEAVTILSAIAEDERQVMDVHEVIEGNPFDALVAFQAVLKQEYGFTQVRGTTVQSFFGSFDQPAVMLDVRTGPGPEDVLQVPVGAMTAPGLGFTFEAHPHKDGLHLTAKVKKLDAPVMKMLAALTRGYLKQHSIYRGKAFKQPSRWDHQPEFLSFDHVDPTTLVLNRPVELAVDRYLLGHLEDPDDTTKKWMAVLAGFYGTGKSFLLSILAKRALENGRTVIYADDTGRIADAITTGASRYGPILVIAEDLDRVVSSRDTDANEIINTISGVLSNQMDAMVVVSTNHPEKIDKAMIRPGRVDVFLNIPLPDEDAIGRLIYAYGEGKVQVNGGMELITRALVGKVAAATVKNVVDLARKAARRQKREFINEDDLLAAVTVMEPQLELLNRKEEAPEPSLDAALKNAVRKVTLETFASAFNELHDQSINEVSIPEMEQYGNAADRLGEEAERVLA